MTNAEARFNKSLRPRKPEGSLGWTPQDVHLDSHTAPEVCICQCSTSVFEDFCAVPESAKREPLWPSWAGKQKVPGSTDSASDLPLTSESWGLWTLSCDFVPHN